jgi:acyl-homoserine lactone synthase
MIHVVTAENRHRYEDALEQHFRVRHDIYVGERKWEALRRPDGRERDEFDTDDTIYLLAIENQRVIGGSRWCATTKPHLLSEVFPHLADVRGVPRAPDIFEVTRMFIVKERREESAIGASLANQIRCAQFEFCLTEGIRAFSLIMEVFRLPRMHSLGWKVDPLGLPTLIENGWWLAALVHVNEEVLQSTRRKCGFDRPLLVREGISEFGIKAA